MMRKLLIVITGLLCGPAQATELPNEPQKQLAEGQFQNLPKDVLTLIRDRCSNKLAFLSCCRKTFNLGFPENHRQLMITLPYDFLYQSEWQKKFMFADMITQVNFFQVCRLRPDVFSRMYPDDPGSSFSQPEITLLICRCFPKVNTIYHKGQCMDRYPPQIRITWVSYSESMWDVFKSIYLNFRQLKLFTNLFCQRSPNSNFPGIIEFDAAHYQNKKQPLLLLSYDRSLIELLELFASFRWGRNLLPTFQPDPRIIFMRLLQQEPNLIPAAHVLDDLSFGLEGYIEYTPETKLKLRDCNGEYERVTTVVETLMPILRGLSQCDLKDGPAQIFIPKALEMVNHPAAAVLNVAHFLAPLLQSLFAEVAPEKCSAMAEKMTAIMGGPNVILDIIRGSHAIASKEYTIRTIRQLATNMIRQINEIPEQDFPRYVEYCQAHPQRLKAIDQGMMSYSKFLEWVETKQARLGE